MKKACHLAGTGPALVLCFVPPPEFEKPGGGTTGQSFFYQLLTGAQTIHTHCRGFPWCYFTSTLARLQRRITVQCESRRAIELKPGSGHPRIDRFPSRELTYLRPLRVRTLVTSCNQPLSFRGALPLSDKSQGHELQALADQVPYAWLSRRASGAMMY